jgi:hypothetical protein
MPALYPSALLHVPPAVVGSDAHNSALSDPMADVLHVAIFFNNRRAAMNDTGLSRSNGKHHDGGGGGNYSVTDHFEPSLRLNPQQDYPANGRGWQVQIE